MVHVSPVACRSPAAAAVAVSVLFLLAYASGIGTKPVAPVAYQVILEPGRGQFREFESPRVHTRINSWGLFFAHKLTCGKRESVSKQHSMKNRRAVGLLSPMRDKNCRQEPGGRTDDTCDHGLSRSWKVEVCEEKKYI